MRKGAENTALALSLLLSYSNLGIDGELPCQAIQDRLVESSAKVSECLNEKTIAECISQIYEQATNKRDFANCELSFCWKEGGDCQKNSNSLKSAKEWYAKVINLSIWGDTGFPHLSQWDIASNTCPSVEINYLGNMVLQTRTALNCVMKYLPHDSNQQNFITGIQGRICISIEIAQSERGNLAYLCRE